MPFTIALINPQIPPNTGNIARLCAATNTKLDIVGNIGFSLDNKALKRAGLDYWEHVNWEFHPNTDLYFKAQNPNKLHLLSKKAATSYWDHTYQNGDILVFGSELTGIPESYMTHYKDRLALIPMSEPKIRSLNLATSAGIVLFEAIRQLKKTTR